MQVIAIGNLTWGGTGKTPVVEKFARELRDQGRTLIITDAQAWVLHEPGTGTPASLELMLEHPAAGYSGSMALFTFADIPANAMGVRRQTWTSGFMVPQGMSVKIWVQQFYPLSLMSMARIILHGGPRPTLFFNYRSDENRLWDAPNLKNTYRYTAVYAAGDNGGLVIDL